MEVAVNPVQTLFPKWAAAGTQTKVHGQDAYGFARKAVDAPDNAARLDAAVRAYNSFDHAVTASKELPVRWVVRDVGKYYLGYDAAKAAANLLIGSGLIPGARERVGKQEVLAAREHFHQGLQTYQSTDGHTRYARFRAGDYLGASIEDAATGLVMLRKADVARPLMQGLLDVRNSVNARRPVSPDTVKQIDALFERAGTTFDELIANANTGAPAPTPTQEAKAQQALQQLRVAAGLEKPKAPAAR